MVGDQFVLYLSCRDEKGPLHYADTLCRQFEQYQAQHYPEVRLRVRMGVYAIEPGCLSASAAIDKANFARKQVHSNTRVSAVQFDKKLEVKQTLTGELLSGLPQALENGEFKLYLQPKFSPKDLSVIGAEALTRCSSNARGTDFLREIVHLVKRLGFNVICEGIETEEQVQLLRSLDCDGAQGFWFSKAIPAEEFERRYLCS